MNETATRHVISVFNRGTFSCLRDGPRVLSGIGNVSPRGTRGVYTSCHDRFTVHDVAVALRSCNVNPHRYLTTCGTFNNSIIKGIARGPCILYLPRINMPFSQIRAVTSGLPREPGSSCEVGTKVRRVLERGLCISKRAYVPHSGLLHITTRFLGAGTSAMSVVASRLYRRGQLISGIFASGRCIFLVRTFHSRGDVDSHVGILLGFPPTNRSTLSDRVRGVRGTSGVSCTRGRGLTVGATIGGNVLVLANNPKANGAAALGNVLHLFRDRKLSVDLTTPAKETTGEVARLANGRTGAVRQLLRIR